DKATKFIGRGSASSSTGVYAKAWGERANGGQYTAEDRVFVSAEGQRPGRMGLDAGELGLATDAGATIITDDRANRTRAYNVGEREVAAFLKSRGYTETSPGVWVPGLVGHESRSYLQFSSPVSAREWVDQLGERLAKDRRVHEAGLAEDQAKGRSSERSANEVARIQEAVERVPAILSEYTAILTDSSLTDEQLYDKLKALAGGNKPLFRALQPREKPPEMTDDMKRLVEALTSKEANAEAGWQAALAVEANVEATFGEYQSLVDGWSKALGLESIGIKVVAPKDIYALLVREYGQGAAAMLDDLRAGRVGGIFLPGHDAIVISPFLGDTALTTEVLAHEYGHAIF
ncbi:MAG: hypothetical protein ACREA0_33000, partial [bacterium]